MYKEQRNAIKELKIYKNHLTNQQFKTLKGKVIQGDVLSSRKGLITILKRKNIKISLI